MNGVQALVVMIVMTAGSLSLVYVGMVAVKQKKKTAVLLIALAVSVFILGVLLFIKALGTEVSLPWTVVYVGTVGILVTRNILEASKKSYRILKQEERK